SGAGTASGRGDRSRNRQPGRPSQTRATVGAELTSRSVDRLLAAIGSRSQPPGRGCRSAGCRRNNGPAERGHRTVTRSEEYAMATDPTTLGGDELPPSGRAYDGIEHLDHGPPSWWKGLFAATIVFSVLYLQYYHLGTPGRSAVERYDQALAENMRLQFAEIGELKPDEPTLGRMMNDSRWVRVGESVYRTHCVSCHGIDGGGVVGPNLTDEHYKNARSIGDILRVVQNGAAAGAMPPWRDKLHLNEQILVA